MQPCKIAIASLVAVGFGLGSGAAVSQVLTDVAGANPKIAGVASASVLSPQLAQIVRAQGSMREENPAGLVKYFGYLSDRSNLMPVTGGSVMKLTQASPTADSGKLSLFFKGDREHSGLDNVAFWDAHRIVFVEDAGDTLHAQRNVTGIHVSDGDAGTQGLLGAKIPQPFKDGWRVFYTHQHGDDVVYEIVRNPLDSDDRDNDDHDENRRH